MRLCHLSVVSLGALLTLSACGADVAPEPAAPVSASSHGLVVVQFGALQDTWFRNTLLGVRDHGASCELRVGNSNTPGEGKAVIGFSIPPATCAAWNASPLATRQVRLLLTQQNLAGPLAVNIHQVTLGWVPGGTGAVPCQDCAAFTGAGNPFAAPTFNPAVLDTMNPVNACPAIDANANPAALVPLVNGWCSGAIPNQGLMLRGVGVIGNNYNFGSMEHPNPAMRPRLELTY